MRKQLLLPPRWGKVGMGVKCRQITWHRTVQSHLVQGCLTPAGVLTGVLGRMENGVRSGEFFGQGRGLLLAQLYQPGGNCGQGGNAEAQYQLGKMYEQGQGIASRDYSQAFGWYQKAAEQGNAKAQYALGVLYQTGRGIEKNNDNANLWFQRADEKGSLPAWGALEKIKHFSLK